MQILDCEFCYSPLEHCDDWDNFPSTEKNNAKTNWISKSILRCDTLFPPCPFSHFSHMPFWYLYLLLRRMKNGVFDFEEKSNQPIQIPNLCYFHSFHCWDWEISALLLVLLLVRRGIVHWLLFESGMHITLLLELLFCNLLFYYVFKWYCSEADDTDYKKI